MWNLQAYRSDTMSAQRYYKKSLPPVVYGTYQLDPAYIWAGNSASSVLNSYGKMFLIGISAKSVKVSKNVS